MEPGYHRATPALGRAGLQSARGEGFVCVDDVNGKYGMNDKKLQGFIYLIAEGYGANLAAIQAKNVM